MPAIRREFRCAFASPEPTVKEKKPRAPRRVLTVEEKEEAKRLKETRRLTKEALKRWQEKLPKAWTPPDGVPIRLKQGTLAMFKSDAKYAYKLTEAEILTLPNEEIQCSPKSYFPLKDIQGLAMRKFVAGVAEFSPTMVNTMNIRVRKKTEDNGRRAKGNWSDFY